MAFAFYMLMAKLGYTWYPKDWGNSEKVFELTLIERGLYRELIDMAMLNDNKTQINVKVWSRKFGSTQDEIESILITLSDLSLIEVNNDLLFIPSCESRLKLVRGGRNGGKKSKPTPKPTPKPFESLEEKNEKPTPNQIEKKRKEKESNMYREFAHLSLSIDEFNKLNDIYTKESIDEVLNKIENYSKNKNYKSLYLTSLTWLKKDGTKKHTENGMSESLLKQLRPSHNLKDLYE